MREISPLIIGSSPSGGATFLPSESAPLNTQNDYDYELSSRRDSDMSAKFDDELYSKIL